MTAGESIELTGSDFDVVSAGSGNPDQAGNQTIKGIKRMRRRDFIKSAALASAGGAIGLGIFSQFSGRAIAAGRKKQGAWASELGEPLTGWPLIPIHAVLLGDGRLLTYGTNSNGQQTGFFILRRLGPPSRPRPECPPHAAEHHPD